MPQLVSGVLLYQAFSPYLTMLRQCGGMDSQRSTEGMGRNQDLEQRDRQRPQRTQERAKRRSADLGITERLRRKLERNRKLCGSGIKRD